MRWDAPVKPFLFVAAMSMAAVILACSPVPETSGTKDTESETDNSPDTSSETDTGTWLPGASLVLPTEDLLPDWALNWAKATGGTGMDAVKGISATGLDTFVAAGHVLCGVQEDEVISFDGITVPASDDNMFLVKYTIDGKALWATWAGDGSTVQLGGVGAEIDGRIAVTGYCDDGARFGPGEPNEAWVQTGTGGYTTAFFSAYEPDGSLAWVRSLLLVESPLGTAKSEGYDIVLCEDGSVLATGLFDGEILAGAGTLAETVLSRHPDGESFAYNAYIVKYDADGNLLWARREGGPGKTVGSGISLLPDGSFFVTGGFQGSAVFGEGQTEETTLSALGEESVFLARFDEGGNLQWAVDLGVDGHVFQMIQGFMGKPTVLADGDIALPGTFFGSILAGNGQAVSPVESVNGGLFLSRYTANGEREWTRAIPAVEGDTQAEKVRLLRVAELQDGNLVAAGGFCGTKVFGMGEANESLLQATGMVDPDAVLAAYSASGDFLWALPQGSISYDLFHDVVRFPGGDQESDILVTGGYFSETVLFGTGGSDVVQLTSTETPQPFSHDVVLLRFDREAE
jgi:hypothetical protein